VASQKRNRPNAPTIALVDARPKIVLSRNVTFNEFFMVKISSSQQMEKGQTKGISQWVERSSSSPDNTVSFRMSSVMT